MTRNWKWLASAALALTFATTGYGASGCVVRARARFVVDSEPPPPQQETIPENRTGYVWIHGHWQYEGNRWVWANGYWEQQRPNYVWMEGRWEQRGRQWYWVEGHWEAGGGAAVNNGGGGPSFPTRERAVDSGGTGAPPAVGGTDTGAGHHEHAHLHPHELGDHHHHPHAHPHPIAENHHHPF